MRAVLTPHKTVLDLSEEQFYDNFRTLLGYSRDKSSDSYIITDSTSRIVFVELAL